jgi:hypothetical protein
MSAEDSEEYSGIVRTREECALHGAVDTLHYNELQSLPSRWCCAGRSYMQCTIPRCRTEELRQFDGWRIKVPSSQELENRKKKGTKNGFTLRHVLPAVLSHRLLISDARMAAPHNNPALASASPSETHENHFLLLLLLLLLLPSLRLMAGTAATCWPDGGVITYA